RHLEHSQRTFCQVAPGKTDYWQILLLGKEEVGIDIFLGDSGAVREHPDPADPVLFQSGQSSRYFARGVNLDSNQFNPGSGSSMPGSCQVGAAAAWIVKNADPLQLKFSEELEIVVGGDVHANAGNIIAEGFFIDIECHGENNRHPAKLARLLERLVADNNHQTGLLFADDSSEIELGVVTHHQRFCSTGTAVLDEAHRLLVSRTALALDEQQVGSICRQGQEEGRYEEEEGSQNRNLTPPSSHLEGFL